jgi:hypothetical protein
MNAPDDAVTTLRRMFDCFVKGDIPALMSFVGEDSSWFFPGPPGLLPWAGEYRGPAGLMTAFQSISAHVEYVSYVPHTFFGQGDLVTVLTREECRVKATGKTFVNELAVVAQVKDGKIARFRQYGDTQAILAAFQP